MSEKSPIDEASARASGIRLSGSDRRRLTAGDASDGHHLLTVPDDASDLDPHIFFGDDRPVELEVGCGKGAFLVAAAEMYPDVNFIGVELARPFARSTAGRIARRGLANVRVVFGDGSRLVRDQLRSESLAAVHVFFPDPWPKKRHRKRRLFTAAFLSGATRVLVPGGMLCLATDFEEYYRSMRSLVDASESFERLLAYEWSGEGGVTNFERKYLRAGKTSHRAIYRKRTPPPGR